jgi:salicylate hydroxylase
MLSSFKYIRMHSSTSIEEILQSDDEQRLDHLVQMFVKYQMAGKRYEAKAWHHYFRKIAANPIIFYQNNAAIFYEDNQYDNEAFLLTDPICIHGDLHMGQFHYHYDEMCNERIFYLRQHKKVIAPFTWDLKRLATNLALIAYCHGFSDIEMQEILQAFTRQYIKSVTTTDKINYNRQSSSGNEPCQQMKRQPLRKHCSINSSVNVQRQMYEIDWQSVNTVASLMTLAEQLAIVIAGSHCQPPIPMFPTKDMAENQADRSKEIITTALADPDQQQILINEICFFAMTYAEIAERDHRLFFKHYRNDRIFQGLHIVDNTRIQHPLADARRVPILIVGGGIGGMATALCFARAGIRVRLLERNIEFGEVGAGMQLAPNCSRLLDRLGVLKQVHTNAVFPKQIVWMDMLTGQRLTCIDLGEKFIEEFGYPYIVVHRGDLFQALHQACLASSMVTMETNRVVTSVDERPKSIMVECADGMRYDCDMVVAADGLWSSLRKFVHDDGAPISVGYVTYRGTVGIDQVSKEAGLENVQFWIGPDMHLVQYPIRRGEIFNQAAVFKSKRLPDDTDQWGTKEELNERFSVGCDHIKNALKLLQTNFRWPVYE